MEVRCGVVEAARFVQAAAIASADWRALEETDSLADFDGRTEPRLDDAQVAKVCAVAKELRA